MFGVDSSELLIVAVVALVVIGPKDLPRVMRVVGQWVGRARGMARHFRSGIDAMIRESELEEMEKKWREENDRIMREHPAVRGEWSEQEALAPPGREAEGLEASGAAAGEVGEADLPSPQEELPLPAPERPERELP